LPVDINEDTHKAASYVFLPLHYRLIHDTPWPDLEALAGRIEHPAHDAFGQSAARHFEAGVWGEYVVIAFHGRYRAAWFTAMTVFSMSILPDVYRISDSRHLPCASFPR
jgi:hypothetical protein